MPTKKMTFETFRRYCNRRSAGLLLGNARCSSKDRLCWKESTCPLWKRFANIAIQKLEPGTPVDPEGNPVRGLASNEKLLFAKETTDDMKRYAYMEILNIVVTAWNKRVKELECLVGLRQKELGIKEPK